MASATPPNGLRSPTKPQDGGQRVPVAIPLHYPNHRRANSRAVSQETTTSAKSEKSDAGSGDERHTAHGGQHPMTPESLSSSIHKPEESSSGSRDERLSVPEKAPDAAEHVNGELWATGNLWERLVELKTDVLQASLTTRSLCHLSSLN